MSDLHMFALPDVGEGLVEADILQWLVEPGQTVDVNQTLVEIETAKAAVELPSPYAGVISQLHAQVGETVAVGRIIVTIDGSPGGAGPTSAQSVAPPKLSGDTPPEEKAAGLLVGYGPQDHGLGRRRRRATPVPPRQDPAPVETAPESAKTVASPRVMAKPPVRALAKELGVDLRTISPSGAGGIISRQDVLLAAEPAAQPTSAAGPRQVAIGLHGEAIGRETRIPIKGVRKHTAAAMVRSAFSAPHVTEFVTLDITSTMQLRDTIMARREFKGVKLSPLVFVARALLLALRRTPEANASWDEAAQEIVQKHYVNLGIAAATGRGLVVPNIKDADQLSLHDLATAITMLAETARAGDTPLAAMSSGTITITNIGSFGIDTGTPILNPGEAAILAFGTIRKSPWVVERDGVDCIEPRSITQLALSFDHRLMDGQQGSQLLADTAAVLTEPGLALL